LYRDGKKALGENRSPLAITDGEVNFLWSFIQGSIMDPGTWNRLLNSYGFCERHAWIHISVEMAFREGYLLGPTILYQGLLEKALHAFGPPRVIYWTMRQLRTTDACMLCALNIARTSAGAASPARLDRGRDITALRSFVADLRNQWRDHVCGECAGPKTHPDANRRCRRHLLSKGHADKALGVARVSEQLQELYEGVTRYQNSFVADGAEATDQDRAALIGAIGWCSGWRPLLDMLDSGSRSIDGYPCQHYSA
jgi:hypothetical protein